MKNTPDDRSHTLELAWRWHDMGGDTAGPIPMEEFPDEDHDFSLWEKRFDTLMIIGSAKGFFTVDGLRRVLEDMARTCSKP